MQKGLVFIVEQEYEGGICLVHIILTFLFFPHELPPVLQEENTNKERQEEKQENKALTKKSKQIGSIEVNKERGQQADIERETK